MSENPSAAGPVRWVAGENCDFLLSHENHAPVPLICAPVKFDPVGARVRIHHEVYFTPASENERHEIRHLWFRVLLADRMLAPNGSFFPVTTDTLREQLNAVLREREKLRLTTRLGTVIDLYGKDHVVIQSVYAAVETLEIHLSTRSLTDIPANAKDCWLADHTFRSSCWNTAVWR